MSESKAHAPQEHVSQGASPLAAAFLTFSLLLVLVGGAFVAWKFLAKQEAAKTADAKAAQKAEAAAKLAPYKIDPETGKLSKADGAAGQGQTNEEYRPQVGEFELIDRSGKKISNKDLLGQPYAVSFIFTKCWGPCLNITGQMARLQKELGDAPVRLVSITVDPKYDTPAVLRNYSENFGAQADRWYFLTGEADEVYKVLRENFRQFVREETGEARQRGFEVAHQAGVLHIDAQGRIVKSYLGSSNAEMTQLRMALLKEAKNLPAAPEGQTAEKASASNSPAVAEKPLAESEGGN